MIEFLKEIFGDEALTFEQLSERLGENEAIKVVNAADGSYVPKEDYDAVSAQLTEANAQLTEAEANAEKYADFDQQLQAAKDEGAAQLKSYKRNVKISQAFNEAQVSDEVSVRANLDLDKVQLGEDDALTGLDDQLTALKESKPYLFTQPQQQLELGGSTPGAHGEAPVKGIEAAVADYYNK